MGSNRKVLKIVNSDEDETTSEDDNESLKQQNNNNNNRITSTKPEVILCDTPKNETDGSYYTEIKVAIEPSLNKKTDTRNKLHVSEAQFLSSEDVENSHSRGNI